MLADLRYAPRLEAIPGFAAVRWARSVSVLRHTAIFSAVNTILFEAATLPQPAA